MEQIDYKKYTISTVENYPYKYRKHIKALFVEAGIAQESSQVSLIEPEAIDIADLDLNQQLAKCFERDDRCLSIVEKWEYTKDYKYSVLFMSDDFDGLVSSVTSQAAKYEDGNEPLFGRFEQPSYLDMDSILLLKFNLKFEAIHPQTEDELFTRYPVVLAFHREHRIVEIRFDALKRFFMETPDYFYAQLVENAQSFIQENCGKTLQPLDLGFLIDKVQHEDAGVHLVAQTMRMKNGTYAELQVDKNEDYVLPFIGELKNLLLEHESEFAKVPSLKEAFDQFIFEKEATSDYPWIELLWENEIKTRSIHVKFTFNYNQKEYCLLQHYFNTVLIGMERMNHVVKFISEARGDPQCAVQL